MAASVVASMLDGETLHGIFRAMVRDRVIHLAGQHEGSYTFEEDSSFVDVLPLYKLNPVGLVVEAMRRRRPPDKLLVRARAMANQYLHPLPGLAAAADKLTHFMRGKDAQALAAAEGGITLAFCWSHVRREFFDLAKGKTAPIATETLQRIAALYAIETDLRGKPPDLRRAGRQERSRPLVEDLFAWLSAQLARLPGGSPTAGAIRYTLNHREGLVRFLEDGRIELDNNTVERAIRPICLSRKNALFASGDDGGARWAAVASLVETCKLNAVDPQRYFTDVLNRLVNGWPNSRIDELMPWCWADPDKA